MPFEAADLDLGNFRSIEPVRKPPVYAAEVVAWEGVYPEYPEVSIRVEGASLDGRVVHFEVVAPWELGPEPPGKLRSSSDTTSRTFVAHSLFYLAALIGGVILARHNQRLGRGDRRGAGRLAAFVFVLAVSEWIIGERHVAVFVEEVASAYLWVARAVFAAAGAWIGYIVLEPYIRRFWPQTIITWSRLLKGNFRDPLVGRDILVGAVVGIILILVVQIDALLPSWLGLPRAVPKLPGFGYDIGELLGLRYKLGTVISLVFTAISLGLASLVSLLLLRIVVRIRWLASLLFCVLVTATLSVASSCDTFLPWLTNGALAIGLVLVLTRIGLVAAIVATFVQSVILTNPVTSDFSMWYAPSGGFAVLVAAALLLYGFTHALAGRPILSQRLIDE